MAHSHSHGTTNYSKAFALGIALNFSFVLVEFFYGKVANSMALIADAGHNLSDVLILFLAWGAAYLSKQSPTPNRTYGLRRSSILAALINALLLLIALGAIAWESVRRINVTAPIEEHTVMWVAGVGIVINAITALLFFRAGGTT